MTLATSTSSFVLARRSALRLLAAPLVGGAALALVGCSKQEDLPAESSNSGAKPTQSTLDQVASTAKGFTVGALMSANTVYVMFDPQCPHCGHLWNAAQPLMKKAKFVWIPISFINGKSAPQGAALLAASNPAELMTAHETSLLAGTGGLSDTPTLSSEQEAVIKTNTQLLNSLKVESVPFVITKNAQTGQVLSNVGAMDTAALAAMAGVTL